MTEPVNSRRIVIFDTTLRDGEQSPGASMNLAEKTGGRPGPASTWASTSSRPASPSPRPAISRPCSEIARNVRGPYDLRPGPLQRRRHRPRLGGPASTPSSRGSTSSWPPAPSIASSSSRWTRTRSSSRAVAGVKRAAGYCDDVEFSPEDAARTEIDFLCRGGRSGHRRRRHDRQHPRHRRLRHARAHVRRDPQPPQARAQHRQGRDQRPLPQRPGPGRGQQPGRRRGRRRPGRMHDQRHRRAGRQLLAGRGRHGPAHAARLLPRRHAASTPSGSCPPAGWCRTSPASRCSGTRRSSAKTPSPTRPASTRTACSRNARPTRSCGPRTSALPRPTWCWASTAAAPPWPDRIKALGYSLDERAAAERLRAVQGAGRQEEGDLRRRHRCADRAGDAASAGSLDVRFLHHRHRHGQDPHGTPPPAQRPRRGSHGSGRRRRPDRRHVPGHRATDRRLRPIARTSACTA